MTAQIWPFKPRDGLIESLDWRTDVFQAKAAEQRIALREAPRRTFNMDHFMTEYEYSAARAMIWAAQGGDEFLAPDWAQSIVIGSVSPGSPVTISVDLTTTDMGTSALLWESISKFEQVTITNDSNGVSLATVVNDYDNARLMPLWAASCPEGFSVTRSGGRIVEGSVARTVRDNSDLGLSTYTQYRGLDIIPTCPVIGASSFDESIGWQVTTFDNQQSIPYYLRQRSYPDTIFQMRWHEFTRAGLWEVRQWMHSRRGRQKAFWLSSRGRDFEPAANISGTTEIGRAHV
jgi:hypothetical protein